MDQTLRRKRKRVNWRNGSVVGVVVVVKEERVIPIEAEISVELRISAKSPLI